MPALRNTKHEAFCQARAKGLSIDAAYVEAGYEPHRGNASRLSANESIRRRIEELSESIAERVIERTGITKERVLEELGKLGFANMLDYLRPAEDGYAYIDLSELTREQAAAIQEVTVDSYDERNPDGDGDETRTVKKMRFKLADKRAALVDIGKHLGMFKDKVELTGKDGGPIETEEVGGREIARRMAFLLAHPSDGAVN